MPDDDRLEFLGQIAAWYFEDGLDQTEIGRRIRRSRSMVSRLLQEARDRGLVQIHVTYPLRTDRQLERGLVDDFDLTEARVLAGETSTATRCSAGWAGSAPSPSSAGSAPAST